MGDEVVFDLLLVLVFGTIEFGTSGKFDDGSWCLNPEKKFNIDSKRDVVRNT